ncbi:hypothetical protein [Paenibacillus sp. FSL H7-0331]|uniref:hypothetical protein n=2 Tax=Paenibacillus sp. FSL H7-0331 TaxID=1920421 RepID=UPI00096DCEC9|nr:hypothetical protein [Paenibacillus sp. FSL H7-0331]OMF02625.1 hypothetical protein BK127_37085 [Paenibacillus sp. FSL H7-0331]
MKIFSKKDNVIKQDILCIDMEIETRKEYKNITRQKGRMVPVIDWRISLYINGSKLDEDEVFVEDEFFKSLLNPGKYPMFTCTCGIFGCGGYYVEVIHEGERVIWLTEQSPFEDRAVKSLNKFIFSWDQIISFSEELVQKFENLKSLMNISDLDFHFDVERYSGIINEIKVRKTNNNF